MLFFLKVITIFMLFFSTLSASCDSSLLESSIQSCESDSVLTQNDIAPCCGFRFDAKDDGQSSNIRTKYVNTSFDLNISYIHDSAPSTLLDFNGTLCVRLIDDNATVLSSWKQNNLLNQSSVVNSFELNESVQVVKLELEWKEDVNTSCPISSPTDTYNLSDSFSVRPDKIVILNPLTSYTSQSDILITLRAEDASSNIDVGYTLPSIDANVSKKFNDGSDDNGSLNGDITTNGNSIINGTGDINISFSDVALVVIDINDSSWTSVDSADGTPASDLYITAELNTSFVPAEFNISMTPLVLTNAFDGNFTYYYSDLNDSNMSASFEDFNITVSAVGSKGIVVQNYTGDASSVKLFAQELTSIEANISGFDGAEFINEPKDINTSFDANFTNGVATFIFDDVRLNYNRDITSVQEPRKITANDINITFTLTDEDNITGTNTISGNDGNLTFYYGRVYSSDIVIQGDSNTTQIYYEAYCSSDCSDFDLSTSISDASWYVNTLHNSLSLGQVLEYSSSDDNTRLNGSITSSTSTIGFGIEDLNLSTIASVLPTEDRVEMNASSWLLYNPYVSVDSVDFNVKFTPTEENSTNKEGGSWTGLGEEGEKIDINLDKSSRRSMEW